MAMWRLRMVSAIVLAFLVSPKANLVVHGREVKGFSCGVCVEAWEKVEADLIEGTPLDDVIQYVVNVCAEFVYSDENVCRVQIEMHAPTLSWVILNTPTLDAERICGKIFGAVGCTDQIDPNLWLVDLPPTPKSATNWRELAVMEPDIPAVKIVQISDFHWDPDYVPGTESLCSDLICCNTADGPGVNEPAGQFGSYNDCDTPKKTIEAAVQHVHDTHPDAAFILFTGDIPHHDIWNRTTEQNLQMIDTVSGWLKAYFENLTVFPVLGNSETIPFDVYSFSFPAPPEEISTGYIFEDAWKNWQSWLPADQQDNVLKGGQYSVSPQKGLRIIGFNSMFGYLYNWFVWMGQPDPNEHLAWLASELQRAEANDESVYLLGHVPPGSNELDPVWSHNFHRIVNRFKGVIRGQFFGHTHKDEFSVFFDTDDRPSHVAFVGPSVTPYYQKLNPGYRVYYVDGARGSDSTWAVLDHETWIFDLEAANLAGEPTWVKSYSMKEAYGMLDLTPQSYLALTDRLKTDDETFNFFYAQYFKQSERRPHCDAICRETIICALLTSDGSDLSRC